MQLIVTNIGRSLKYRIELLCTLSFILFDKLRYKFNDLSFMQVVRLATTCAASPAASRASLVREPLNWMMAASTTRMQCFLSRV